MSKQSATRSHWAARNDKNTVRLLFWTGAWVLTTALAAFGPKLIWNFDTTLTTIGVVLNIATGCGMIVVTGKHVQGLDEMQRKIFLDAGILSLGVGLVCGLSYELLEDIKLISFEPEISHLMVLMCIAFIVGNIAGHRKYR